jgi:DNA-binding transcriptional ArsR family regulator
MSVRENESLEFACECVSSGTGYSDPWAAVAQNKLLPGGTKQQILNVVAREPKTIAQLAKELGLSQPSIHTHVSDMMASELLRESAEWEKKYPAERYYEPNFPVINACERAEMESVCRDIAREVAELFEHRKEELEHVFEQTSLGKRGWGFPDLTQYLYASIQRGARQMLEERGTLPQRQEHKNGAKWIFWAEEPNTSSSQK